MKLKSLFFCWGLFCIFLSPQIKAQEQLTAREKADKLFEEFQYAKAAPMYQRLSDVTFPRLLDMQRLAECYRKMNKYEDAEIWYARVVKHPDSRPEDLIKYGEMLQANAQYPEAKQVFQDYQVKTGDKKLVTVNIAGCDSAYSWLCNPTNHFIKNEEAINTDLSEFSAFQIGNSEVSFAGEPELSKKQKKYGWTGCPYLRIFVADRQNDNSLKAKTLSETVYNYETFHVGPISTNKANTIYFITRTYPGRKGSLSKINKNIYRTQKMELYIQKKVDGRWQKPVPFAYNNVQKYSLGHAVLSNDEKILYFVSDMPGGYGGTDIWYSELQPDGTWGKCFNAGNAINTSGDEMFPTIAPDGTLYYSSNGMSGMGGLDIYYSEGSGYQWERPRNMRYPVNSPGDDFSYVVNADLSSGYLSSNRVNGKGGDDIYSFVIQKNIGMFLIEGTVYDKKTGKILPNADIVVSDKNNTLLAKQKSNPDGKFHFNLERRDLFKMKSTMNGYYPDTVNLRLHEPSSYEIQKVAFYLDPLFEVGKTYKLENIHYNFDKDNIRQDASIILEGLVKIMHENPTLKIELASHTDSRGTEKYNEILSQRRAQSVVDYLVSRGISRDRMTAKGYGESHLINQCADGVDCSEAEHQRNRRTEFTVLSY